MNVRRFKEKLKLLQPSRMQHTYWSIHTITRQALL